MSDNKLKLTAPNAIDQITDYITESLQDEQNDIVVRSVQQYNLGYNIFEVPESNGEISWYVAISDDGVLIGCSISEYWTTKMAEAYIEYMHTSQSDDSSKSQDKFNSMKFLGSHTIN